MELVVFVGLQGSGKSTWYRERYGSTHAHVSKDLMRSARDKDRRQAREIEAALTQGMSVVVDNTNPSPEVRAPLLELARRLGARAVAVFFDEPLDACLARNRAREGRARVPDVALFVTAKALVPPRADEGFDEIHRVREGSLVESWRRELAQSW